MRTWKRLLVVIGTWIYLPLAIAASPEGIWTAIDDITGNKRAVVRFQIHNNVLSATIESVYPQPGDTGVCSNCPGDFKDKPTKGMKFIWGLTESNPGNWEGGKILDAKSGKIYQVKMTVKGDKLYVRGYVGVAMLGRTQIWVREKEVTS